MAAYTTESNSRVLADKEVNFVANGISDSDVKGYMYKDEIGRKVIKLITTNGNRRHSIFISRDNTSLDRLQVNVYSNFIVNTDGDNTPNINKCDDDALRDKTEELYNLTYSDLFAGLKEEWQFNGISRISNCYTNSESTMLTLGDFFMVNDCPGKIDLVEVVKREDFLAGFNEIVKKLKDVNPTKLIEEAIKAS